jgi:hypothetical protein
LLFIALLFYLFVLFHLSSLIAVYVNHQSQPSRPRELWSLEYDYQKSSGDSFMMDGSIASSSNFSASSSSSSSATVRPRRSDDWNEYRTVIERLYRDHQLKLKDVKRIMEHDYNFVASYCLPFFSVFIPSPPLVFVSGRSSHEHLVWVDHACFILKMRGFF